MQAVIARNHLGSGQDLVAVAPVHVEPVAGQLHIVERQEIHGNDQFAHLAKLAGDLQVRPRIAAVVGAAHDHQGALVGLQARQDLLPAPPFRLFERLLGRRGGFQRPLQVGGVAPQLPRHALQGLDPVPQALLQVDDRLQHLHAGRGEVHRRLARVAQALHIRTDEAVSGLGLLALQVDHTGQPDVVNLMPLDEVEDMAQGDLHRETRLGDRLLGALVDDLLVRGVREDDLAAQLGQQRLPEGVELVEEQGPRDAHAGAAGG